MWRSGQGQTSKHFFEKSKGINRDGTKFRPKMGDFFLVELLKILKEPSDVKLSADSKNLIFMIVVRREVHDFSV